MKILITGAKGQLGGALCREAPDSHRICAVGREDFDLADSASLKKFLQAEAPDIILNAAAYTAVDKAEQEQETARAINSDAVAEMVELMEKSGGQLVHVSTDFVFDGLSAQPHRPADPCTPLSVYGRTKAQGEQHLRDSDLLVRTSWVYEAGGQNFVRTMIRLMKERNELSVVADQIGSPTWATGLARSIWGLLAKRASGIYHHSDAGVCSWYDFAVAIAEECLELGIIDRAPAIRPISTAEYPTAATRPAFSVLDCRATRAFLDDQPMHWRSNLRTMLKEEQALG